MVDLDQDGNLDVVSGCYPGPLHLFAGQGDGTFAAATTLRDADDQVIQVGMAAALFVADLDRDGDLDLVVGDIEGRVWFVPNESGSKALRFGAATPLEAAGETIRVPFGDAGPVVADWDGDGTLDLVVGAGDGSVRWFPNEARAGAPRLGEGRALLERAGDDGAEDASRPGLRAKPCVTDFDGDGRLDLLVGDLSMTAPDGPAPTEAQQARIQEIRRAVAAIEEEVRPRRLALLRETLAAIGIEVPEDGEPDPSVFARLTPEQQQALVDDLQARMEADEELATAQARLTALQEEEDGLSPRARPHGHVWLLRRRPPVAEASAPAGS